ncbi:MAG: F0F1 ATP synthase subunit B [Phycisphaerae bacterium]|jgi:F-type H+-transporting ATPase subunit b
MKKIRIIILLFISRAVFASEQAAELAGETEEKLNLFSGYLSESVWTLVWFGLLILILGKFVWKPMLAALKGRQEHIEGEISRAEKTNAEAMGTLEQYKAKLSEAENEGKKLVQQRVAEADLKSRDVITKAMQEADAIKAKARADAQKAAGLARSALIDEAGDIVCMLGSRIIGRVITPEDNEKLISEAVEKFKLARAGEE